MVYDLIIIGAGPAGITGAVYAARKGMKLLVVSKDVGGQVTKTSIVENYTGYQEITGKELAEKFERHLREFKFDFKTAEVKKIEERANWFLVKTEKEEFKSKALLIATGAKPRMLGADGEKQFIGRGVTYCATCDAPLFSGKNVVVIGGGNSALESVLQLMNIANKIYVVNNTSHIKADAVLMDKVKKSPKVRIFNNSNVTKILGKKFVEKVVFICNEKENILDVEGVFINIGYVPNTDIAKGLLKLNQKGEIEIDLSGKTSKAGIFAAGDCTNAPYKQIITAAGAGAAAALSAFKYLSKR